MDIRELSNADQRLYAEITYSWLLTRLNQIKRAYGMDFLFIVVTDDYDSQFFLMSAAEPGAVRGNVYGQYYLLGTTLSVGEYQVEAMRAARQERDGHLADAGQYVDYYRSLCTFDRHMVFIGLTYDQSDLLADVSGKGIPAALFMMASKIILANNAKMGKSPAQILADTNTSICSNNDAEMFVTVWLGILELSTGRLVAANAGHEYPTIKHAGGSWELVHDKHGFVIGGMDGMHYKEYELMLEPGAKLFVYTDGLAEASDAEENMYGTDRMLAALNKVPDATPEETIEHMRESVDAFVGGAEQFDDLTMLCVSYRGIA